MWTVLAGFTVALGPLAMFNLYFMPYWINVMWLDAVTYLHHHGPEDQQQIPWYRGEVYSFWPAFDHLVYTIQPLQTVLCCPLLITKQWGNLLQVEPS